MRALLRIPVAMVRGMAILGVLLLAAVLWALREPDDNPFLDEVDDAD